MSSGGLKLAPGSVKSAFGGGLVAAGKHGAGGVVELGAEGGLEPVGRQPVEVKLGEGGLDRLDFLVDAIQQRFPGHPPFVARHDLAKQVPQARWAVGVDDCSAKVLESAGVGGEEGVAVGVSEVRADLGPGFGEPDQAFGAAFEFANRSDGVGRERFDSAVARFEAFVVEVGLGVADLDGERGGFLAHRPLEPDRLERQPPDKDRLELTPGTELAFQPVEPARHAGGVLGRQGDPRPGQAMLDGVASGDRLTLGGPRSRAFLSVRPIRRASGGGARHGDNLVVEMIRYVGSVVTFARRCSATSS